MTESTLDFRNDEVDPAGLPDFYEATLYPVDDRWLPYALISRLWFFLAALLVVTLGPATGLIDYAMWTFWAALGLVALLLWTTVLTWMDARLRGWALREHDLIYRAGVVWRRTVILPFARIQHVETTSGPLERMFGLNRLKCFTAGGMSADLSVLGLDQETAEQVREYLLEQIRDDESNEPGSSTRLKDSPMGAAGE